MNKFKIQINLILTLLLSILLGINSCFAIDNSTYTSQNIQSTETRSGCCSWHGGVCGCYAGRVVCCDGTLSPSCRCYHDQNNLYGYNNLPQVSVQQLENVYYVLY